MFKKAKAAMEIITLENELFQCRLLPGFGSAIHSFDCKLGNGASQPLLRHATKTETTDVLDCSSWPLVPFSNRIKYGAFTFEGKPYTVATNYLGGPNGIHASHGQGWQFPWTLEKTEATSCELSFVFDPSRAGMAGLWPFPYAARQRLTLTETGLATSLSVTNTGTTNMPAGLGHHPYFPKIPGTTLQATVGGLWEIDGEVIPVREVPVPAEYEFSTPKALDEARLDSCFSGYRGQMQIVWPGKPVALNLTSSPNLTHFVVYTPVGGDFFCAEPISHKPNAVNDADWTRNGLIVLPPGKTMEATYAYEALRMPDAPETLARLKSWRVLDLA